MKLAEALSRRKDLQKRIEQVKGRLRNNVKVQEGEEPLENPNELKKELEACLKQLEDLIFRINKTNMATLVEGEPLTALMARRDVLTKHVGALREVFSEASSIAERYSRSEIKQVCTIDVPKLSKEIDALSKELRELDYSIQVANFQTELL